VASSDVERVGVSQVTLGWDVVSWARIACAALALAAAASACSSAPEPSAPAKPTPIARLNTDSMAVPRIDFCTLVPDVAVDHALGGTGWKLTQWHNGDRTDVTGTGSDVVAEHGCAWTAQGGSTIARAWIFAEPVSRRFARFVVRREGATSGCRRTQGPAFGDPSTTQTCVLDGRQRVRHAGLFGDTWLSCEVEADLPIRKTRRRADDWCVEVVNALNTTD
jgi:hypothetical protein